MENIFVTKPSMPPYEEYANEIKDIWETRHITNFGPKYQKFIAMLKERFGYTNIDLQCNGHMVLQNLLSTLPEGEIITTPFTFVSTTLSIVNSGHTPVFCDIRKSDYNIDPDKIEELITDKTVAIVPVHVYGSPCDVEKIMGIAKKHSLKVIYDAAHAFNVKIDGVNIGEFGDASMFSLHGTKVFNSVEGGMAVTKDEKTLDEIRQRSNFGINATTSDIDYYGVNSKMNEFQASMGIVNLKYLDENVAKRKAITERYDERLKGIEGITYLKRCGDVTYNYAYYPLLIERGDITADDFARALGERNIFPRRYFYPSINDMKLFKHFKGDAPIATEISKKIVCLPIYSDLTLKEVDYVCDSIIEILK